jgi:magnesium chelatase family protein
MMANVACAVLMGIDAFKVELEVDCSRSGMPAFTMVGLAKGAVKESKERVLSALKICGFKVPPARMTVILAPADVRAHLSTVVLMLVVRVFCVVRLMLRTTNCV